MVDTRVEVTADDLSVIGNVLDQYYTFLKNVVGQKTGPIVLFNTITPYDVYDFAPLYNENIFRNYANIVTGPSPVKVDPSSGVNLRDRYSYYYSQVVREAAGNVERKHLTPDQKAEIRDLENDIDNLRDKRDKNEDDLSNRWERHADRLGLDPKTIEYDLEKVNYYNTSGLASQIAEIFSDILAKNGTIQSIKESAVPNEYRALLRINDIVRSAEYKLYRPRRPNLEQSGEMTYIQLLLLLANARAVQGLLTIVDSSEDLQPFTDLSTIFKDGERSFTIEKKVDEFEQHDVDWSASASGSYFSIVKANASASYSKSIKKSFESTNKIRMGFKNINEYYVARGDWFDTSIFDLDVVQDVLKRKPELAANTSVAIASVFVGRGLEIGFNFSEASAYEEMKEFKSEVGGSANIGFFSFGGKGSYRSYDYEQENRDASQEIVFRDGDDVCRILGVRVTQVHSHVDPMEFQRRFMLAGEFAELQEKLNEGEGDQES